MRMRDRLARALAAVGLVIGVIALALQFALTLGKFEALGGNWIDAIWRLAGFFTILTNVLVTGVLAAATLGRRTPRFELSVATAIAIVGLVYSLLLRATWRPAGWDKLADALLHDIAPPLFVAYFLLRTRVSLGLRDAAIALIFPVLYIVYALARGAVDGWYAYWFLDPRNLSATQMALNLVGLTAVFLAMSLTLMWLSNRLCADPRGGYPACTIPVSERSSQADGDLCRAPVVN